MKSFLFLTTLIYAGILLFSAQGYAAQTRCTTDELDLMCENGQALQGIDATGTKLCITLGGVTALDDEYRVPNAESRYNLHVLDNDITVIQGATLTITEVLEGSCRLDDITNHGNYIEITTLDGTFWQDFESCSLSYTVEDDSHYPASATVYLTK